MRLIIDENHQPDGSMHGRISFCFDRDVAMNQDLSDHIWFEAFRELAMALQEVGNKWCVSDVEKITSYARQINDETVKEENCLSCAHSFSEPSMDASKSDILRCIVKHGMMVNENGFCKEYNRGPGLASPAVHLDAGEVI